MKTNKRKVISLVTFSLTLWAAQTALAFYNPEIGRWANRDPIGEFGGINLYEYTLNEPNYHFDGYGLAVTIQPPQEIPTPLPTPPIQLPTSPPAPPSGPCNSYSGCGPGNGPVSHPISQCTVGTYSPVTRSTKPCPNGGSTTCFTWKHCESAGTFPTVGVSGGIREIGVWKPYQRCNPCPPCPAGAPSTSGQ
jgi:hypothetical protein